jgi:Ca2+-transporting ATPase
MEPPHTSQLNRPPRDPGEPIITKRMLLKILLTALIMGAGSIYLFYHYYQDNIVHARSMVFTFLVVVQWLNVINARSETSSILTVKPFSNRPLILGLIVAFSLQMFVIYTPYLDRLFEVTPLAITDWVIIVPMALTTVIVSELEKLIYRIYHN